MGIKVTYPKTLYLGGSSPVSKRVCLQDKESVCPGTLGLAFLNSTRTPGSLGYPLQLYQAGFRGMVRLSFLGALECLSCWGNSAL